MDAPSLELKVTVLNINYGRNLELMKQCRTLKEYSQYVALVRKYKKELGSLDKEVKAAIDKCIKEGILSDFLRKNQSEVEMTSILEYNQEEEEKKLRVAEWQIGYNEGRSNGYDEGQKIKQNNMINNYMSKKHVSLEEACDTLGVSLKEYREAEKNLKNCKL